MIVQISREIACMHAKYVQTSKSDSRLPGQNSLEVSFEKGGNGIKKILSTAEEECQYQPNQNSLRLWSQIRNEFEF